MLCKISNEAEKQLYIAQMKAINEIICKQRCLPKSAQIIGEILEKLNKLYDSLEIEILKYEKIKKMG